jgi:F-type H+-transporting ATPase subunit c
MLSSFFFLAETTGDVADAGKAIALALGIGLGSLGAGVGIGNIFGNYVSGALRNPSAAPAQFTNVLIGFALAEATGLFGLLIALIILFG